MALEIALVITIITLIIAVPLLIYTFLIFPNINGVVQDIRWYNYDEQSQHFIYWTGFWTIAIFASVGGISVATK